MKPSHKATYWDGTKVEDMQAVQGAHSMGSFIFPRRIGFGECDAARIYKTPRAIDFAVEALDAWYEAVLGISWADLVTRHDLYVTFVRIACEYLRPVTAGQTVHMRVSVVATEPTTITFLTIGEIDAGRPCFQATLIACFVSRSNATVILLPSEYHNKIQPYLPACTDGVPAPHGGSHTPRSATPQGPAGTHRLPLQLNRAEAPFIQQHRVVYGECGMSGKVYAPRVYDYALEAVGEWYEQIIGISWLQQCILLKGQPFVDINCEYLRDMEPGRILNIVVKVTRLGAASIVYSVVGYDDTGLPYFDAQLVACYIDESSGVYKPTPFPEDYRRRILEYQARCHAAD